MYNCSAQLFLGSLYTLLCWAAAAVKAVTNIIAENKPGLDFSVQQLVCLGHMYLEGNFLCEQIGHKCCWKSILLQLSAWPEAWRTKSHSTMMNDLRS